MVFTIELRWSCLFVMLFSISEVCLCPVMTYVLSGQGMYVYAYDTPTLRSAW